MPPGTARKIKRVKIAESTESILAELRDER
jgi:hypothetical protein